jgi:protein involved in polysaccharide export with SLBB domain
VFEKKINFVKYLQEFLNLFMRLFLKNNLVLTAFLFLTIITFSQVISPTQIKNIKVNELTNLEVLNIKNEMSRQNMSMTTLESLALSNGMNSMDFATLKSRIENFKPDPIINPSLELINKPDEKIAQFDKLIIEDTKIFGSDIFTNPNLSFEPNSNMATPTSYILGPGDELQLIIYGMQEYTGSIYVTKEGKVNIPIVGQVFVNGLTFDAAKSQIKKACSKVYSSLNSSQSQLSLSLTKIRTIRVTIIGARKPGNYSVSSLSTVFNALHIAGGPDDNGSYRSIELIRDNKIYRTIDIYKFLTKGDQSDNVNLQENDVIRIPVYENRVTIEGNIKKPGIFELLPSESFTDLLNYCGGFSEGAYKSNIKLVQNRDKELKIINLVQSDFKNYVPNSGDIFKVSELLNRFSNKVSVKGSVYRPDDYEFTEGMTINDLIVKADGLTEDAYRDRSLLIREKQDLTKEIISLDLNQSNSLVLKKNDELIISSIFDLKNQHTVSISGQIKNPGEFPYIEKITLYDLIIQAGGFTNKSSKVVEISRVIIKDEKSNGNIKKAEIFNFEIDTLLLDESKNFILKPEDIVQIRKKPIYEKQIFVLINGQVEYPGSYVISNSEENVFDVLNRSGGLKMDADINGIKVIRRIEGDIADSVDIKEFIIPVNYKLISKYPKSKENFTLQQGDEIFVSKIRTTVKVLGEVQLNSEIPYKSRKTMRFYIRSVGGLKESANQKRIYIVYPNGVANTIKNYFIFKNYPKVLPGSEIVIPFEDISNVKKLSISEISIITGVIGSISGMTVAIINLLKK